MKTHKQFKKEIFKNPDVGKAYDALKFEFDIIRRMMDFKIKNNLSRKDFSKKLGASTYLLDKLMMEPENSRLSVLKKVTNGLGLKLTVK
ncbi:MAG TPA: hypothetical protein VJH63_03195 [Candidatus Paceibacterota bacterium]